MTLPLDPRPADDLLLARAARGDRGAFETFYGRHATAVMAFVAHQLGDRSLAEDATQEAFVRAWRAAGRFRTGAPAEPWLYRIARRCAYDLRARRGPRRLHDGRVLDDPDRPSPEPRAPAATPPGDPAFAARVRAAVDALSDALREAFVLVRLCGRTQDEAARLLDVPVGTVKSRVAAAEASLRASLGDLA